MYMFMYLWYVYMSMCVHKEHIYTCTHIYFTRVCVWLFWLCSRRIYFLWNGWSCVSCVCKSYFHQAYAGFACVCVCACVCEWVCVCVCVWERESVCVLLSSDLLLPCECVLMVCVSVSCARVLRVWVFMPASVRKPGSSSNTFPALKMRVCVCLVCECECECVRACFRAWVYLCYEVCYEVWYEVCY